MSSAVNEILRQWRKPPRFNSIRAAGPRAQAQLDFINYDRFTFNGWRYILCYVDVYSRFAVAIPFKSREHTGVADLLRELFDVYGAPGRLDLDNEFHSAKLDALFAEYSVETHFSHPQELYKNAIVERFNGTLARRLAKWRMAAPSSVRRNWVAALPKIVEEYNASVHSTIGETPIDVFEGRAKPLALRLAPSVPLKHNVGDLVRVLRYRELMKKADRAVWSGEVYRIVRREGRKFILMAINGPLARSENRKRWADYELQLSKHTDYINVEKPEQSSSKAARLKRELARLA